MRAWDEWRRIAKSYHPFRYWLAEEGLDRLQDCLHWVPDRLNDVRYYINNRFVSRSHALTAHPRDIKPGQWCDVGHRFVPCLFNELVDFVEIEQAWMHVAWDDEAREKYKTPWWRSGWLRWRTWRCPEAGLAHLDWSISLTLNEEWGIEKDDPRYGQPTDQSRAAQEIKDLYLWWTQVRPKRVDPYEASGWDKISERRRQSQPDNFFPQDKSEEEKDESRRSLDRLHQLEAEYDQEDEEMLIRLIKVRGSLWT